MIIEESKEFVRWRLRKTFSIFSISYDFLHSTFLNFRAKYRHEVVLNLVTYVSYKQCSKASFLLWKCETRWVIILYLHIWHFVSLQVKFYRLNRLRHSVWKSLAKVSFYSIASEASTKYTQKIDVNVQIHNLNFWRQK